MIATLFFKNKRSKSAARDRIAYIVFVNTLYEWWFFLKHDDSSIDGLVAEWPVRSRLLERKKVVPIGNGIMIQLAF